MCLSILSIKGYGECWVLLHLDIRLWPAVGFVLFKETRVPAFHHVHLWVEQRRVVRDIPRPVLVSKVTRPMVTLSLMIRNKKI
jgi:hypothetical protein